MSKENIDSHPIKQSKCGLIIAESQSRGTYKVITEISVCRENAVVFNFSFKESNWYKEPTLSHAMLKVYVIIITKG